MLTKAFIPYKGYFSSPFARWQGSMANEHAIVLAAETTKRWLAEKNLDPKVFDYVYLGLTVHQHQGFYGGPWAAALMGAAGVPGLWVSQACSTSTVAVYSAAMGVEAGLFKAPFCLMTDRCSNGPHVGLAQSRRARAGRSFPKTGSWTTSTRTPGPARP
ncbi:MAG: hypothetical protein MZV70_12265 [Desulfobacterales bacterium]|nr:hypothetical protein [Desulfobacterales bacterium]